MTRRLAAVGDQPSRAVAYVRVSREREEMISPILQQASIDDHLRRHHLRLVDTIEDLDRTGRTFARAGIQRIITGVEQGLWQTVLVYRYDRFGRNVRDSLVNIARVEQAGGTVVSATEPFDAETAIGKYGRTNILAVAELQSDLIGEAWKATHRHRRERGLPHAGGPRLGYLYDKHLGYTPDPQMAPIVAELYRRYLTGHGYRPLAEWLHERAVQSPRTGLAWTPRGVAYLLDSGFAAGLFRADGAYLPGAHEPIITGKVWEAYQAERARRGQVPARTLAPTTTLAGWVRCKGCGYGMRSKSDQRYGRAYLYVCEQPGCEAPATISRDRAEQAVLTWLGKLAADVDRAAQAKTAGKADRALAEAEITRLNSEAARLTKQLTRLTVKLSAELIGDEEYGEAREEIVHTRETVLTEIGKLKGQRQSGMPSRAVLRGLLRDWHTLPLAGRRAILQPMLRAVVVTRVEGRRCRARVYGTWQQLPV